MGAGAGAPSSSAGSGHFGWDRGHGFHHLHQQHPCLVRGALGSHILAGAWPCDTHREAPGELTPGLQAWASGSLWSRDQMISAE